MGECEFISVPASVGFIALMGIAVLNGVVLISYMNVVVREGTLAFRKAVMEGARRRLRPVMLTASIAALGLFPFLLASGPGAEIQRPLAIVVIGGLVSATALTLILLPVLYYHFGLSGAERLRIAKRARASALVQASITSDAAARAPRAACADEYGRQQPISVS